MDGSSVTSMCVRNGESRPIQKAEAAFILKKICHYNCFNCNYKTGWTLNNRITNKLKKLLIVLGVDENDIHLGPELLREQDVATLLIKKQKLKLNIGWDKKDLP